MQKLLLPRLTKMAVVAAAGVLPVLDANATEVKKTDKIPKPTTTEKDGQWCRPSDLPVYSTKRPAPRPPAPKESQDSELHQKLEHNIRDMRCRVENTTDSLFGNTGPVTGHYELAKRKFQSAVEYLNEPQNSVQRSAAIAMGGLMGFLFAIRGGFIKKTIYITLGATAVASLCYPREAEEQARNAYFECRKTASIAYNYLRGMREGDEDDETMTLEPINRYPATLEDFKNLATEIYSNGKELLFTKRTSS